MSQPYDKNNSISTFVAEHLDVAVGDLSTQMYGQKEKRTGNCLVSHPTK